MTYADLTTLAAVKEWLKTGQTALPTTDDALLTRLISAASAAIQKWLGRAVTEQDWVEIRDGLGGPCEARFNFAAWPVSAVASVEVAGLAIPAVTTAAPLAGGYGFSQTQLYIRGHGVPRAAQIVRLEYTAGYDPIPDDLEQACIEMVCFQYRRRPHFAERSQSLGGAQTVAYREAIFTPRDLSDFREALEQYRARAPIAASLVQAP